MIWNLKKLCKTENPFTLCEKLDIIVVITSLPRYINGFANQIGGTEFIYINASLNQREQRLTCARELGRCLFFTCRDITDMAEMFAYNEFEAMRLKKETTRFCAELLSDFSPGEYKALLARETGEPISKDKNVSFRKIL